MALSLGQRFHPARFLRGEGPEAGPVTLRARRVFILPTRRGLVFAGLLLLMLIGSINYNNGLGFTLTFLLAALFLVAMLHTYRNLLRLRVELGPLAPVFCGQRLRLPLILNDGGHTAHYAIAMRLPGEAAVSGEVPADGWTRLELPCTARRRGRLPLPACVLETRFPLGLFRAWAYAHFDATLLVYPRPAPFAPLPAPAAHAAAGGGSRGRGTADFAGLRGYRAGDSLRHVHWKASARGQGLVTKQFAGERAESLWLEWADAPGGVEQRLSLLVRWVLEADAGELRYGLRLPGREIAPASGAAQRAHCLEALALFDGGRPGEGA